MTERKPEDAVASVPEPAPAPAAPAPKRKSVRALRWGLALLVLLACIFGLLQGSFEICNVETVTEGSISKVTEKCNRPAVTDAGVVAIALLIVLLLSPDLSEFGVFGISLKRRVEAAEAQASKSEAKADKLETQLQIQNLRFDSFNQAAANANATTNIWLVTADEMRQQKDGLAAKARYFERGEDPVPTTKTLADSHIGFAEPALATRLIFNWETLMASIDLQNYGKTASSDIPRYRVSAEDARRFMSVFSDELQTVRAARNNVAHARPIADDELRIASEMSDELVRILKGSLG